MMSELQRSQYLFDSCATFLKTTCLHVSFTAYENFYKLTKKVLSSQMASTFSASEMSEIRNPTVKHISTYTLVHSSIITYMGDPVHNHTFLCDKSLCKCESIQFTSKSWMDGLPVLF